MGVFVFHIHLDAFGKYVTIGDTSGFGLAPVWEQKEEESHLSVGGFGFLY